VRFYRTVSPVPAMCFHQTGGLFSVALSLGSPPPAVSRHRIPVEPGLSSIAFQRRRPSGRLAETTWDRMGGRVKAGTVKVTSRVIRNSRPPRIVGQSSRLYGART
jgi:hypothetical protein